MCSSDRLVMMAAMSTIARGNAAEAAVLYRLSLAGLPTFVPFGDGSAIDVVALLPDDSMLRVQVKSGWVRNGVVLFNSHSTDHGSGERDYVGVADVFAVFVPALDQVFVVPVEDCPKTKGWLRLEPTRNNQRLRIRMAEDYTFERWLESVMQASSLAA